MYVRSMITDLDHNAHVKELNCATVEFSKESAAWVYKRKYNQKTVDWRQKTTYKIIDDIPNKKCTSYIIPGVTDRKNCPQNFGSLSKIKPSKDDAEHRYLSRFGLEL